jgi:curved DNA-binding protein CbpA
MAARDRGGPGPDPYRLLGVPREASREAIAQAWRRLARAEHPDSRPGDAAAPGRFRALAGAWHVLGDPVRRAAYDQALARQQTPPFPSRTPGRSVLRTPTARRLGSPPLFAGPVRVEGPDPVPQPGWPELEEIRLAILTAAALRYLGRDGDWPW